MKKVILVFDGRHFSQGIFDFAKDLNEQSQIMATGIFLPVIDYSELLFSLGGLSGPIFITEVQDGADKIIEENIGKFKVACKQAGIACTAHSDITHQVTSYLKKESRFADLMLISGELFYESLGEDTQERYIDEALIKAECPVIILPETFVAPQKIILAYDGSESSVYAIKQFAYLFPEYSNQETLLVYADVHGKEVPDLNTVEELARLHFENLIMLKLEADPRKYFETWLLDRGNTLLVSGAYGRTAFSELLKKSFIRDVIRDHKVPIFVAHR